MMSHRHLLFHTLLLLLLCACMADAQAAICRVTPTGTGNGSDWSQAASLQSALADANCTDIWVRQGSYTPGDTRAAHFAITRNLRLYGGFSGSEATFEDRTSADPALTILSGQIGDPLDSTDNSYKLLLLDARGLIGGLTTATVIDGFTLRDAYGNGTFPNNTGGALLCRSNAANRPCSPTLARLHFIQNYTGNGGAIAFYTEMGLAEPTISDTVFSGNRGQNNGGAIYARADGPNSRIAPRIARAAFVDNAAHFGVDIGPGGGAIYVNAGNQGGIIDLQIENATFAGNHSPSVYARGGAIYNDGSGGSSTIRLDHVTFSGNTASFQGDPQTAGQTTYTRGSGATTHIARSIVADAHPFRSEASAVIGLHDSVVPPGAPCPNHTTCTDAIEGDPLLGSLQDNGGGTPTLFPAHGGVAVDAVDCGDVATDQRGSARPRGARCDAGAVEQRIRSMSLTVEGEGSVEAWLHPDGGDIPACTQASSPCLTYFGENDATPVLTFTASPDAPWYFDGWSGACIADDTNPLQAHMTLDQDTSCSARFASPFYVVTLAANPAGSGSLTPQGGIDPTAVPHGTALNLIATPHPGWDVADPASFAPTLSCGSALNSSLDADGTLSFTTPAITADCTVTARFANQAPSFQMTQAEVSALVNDAPVTFAGWASDIRSGTSHDPDQSVHFQTTLIGVTPPGAQLFAAAGEPIITADGTLHFTPGPDTGSAMFQIVLHDDAGSDHGGHDTSATALLLISVSESGTDLSLHAEVPATFNYPGDRIHFALRVENAGPHDASDARMQWTPPAELGDIQWFCEPQGAATCTASGSDLIDDAIDIPANGFLRYLIEATLPAPSPATIPSQAQTSPGPDQADPDPLDDSTHWHFHIEGLFRDDFEPSQ